MAKTSTTKIEKRALNTLESVIDEHPTMDYSFNSDDKEMSWDGYINIRGTTEINLRRILTIEFRFKSKGILTRSNDILKSTGLHMLLN